MFPVVPMSAFLLPLLWKHIHLLLLCQCDSISVTFTFNNLKKISSVMAFPNQDSNNWDQKCMLCNKVPLFTFFFQILPNKRVLLCPHTYRTACILTREQNCLIFICNNCAFSHTADILIVLCRMIHKFSFLFINLVYKTDITTDIMFCHCYLKNYILLLCVK
jgi:hypothetical protein